MTSNSRIPQLLSPYVEDVPKDSLILLTSTLSTSVNWLVNRYLSGVYSNDAVKTRRTAPQELEQNANEAQTEDVEVVLVSWMRDWEFWKTEARRAGGLDLASLAQSKRFAFVDGLGSSSVIPKAPVSRNALPTKTAPPTSSTLPIRGSPIPARPIVPTPPTPSPSPIETSKLPSTDLSQTRTTIETAISSLTTSSVLLVLDSPDLLLALQETGSATALQSLILSLRLHPRVQATVVVMASDITPLTSARGENHVQTPLETESQALLAGIAHQSDLIISARGLDTGAAGDVSGVLRITRTEGVVKDQELLYLIKTDGSAKVWERGAGVG